MIVEIKNYETPTIAQWASGVMLKVADSDLENEFCVTFNHSNIDCGALALERIGKSFGDFAIIPIPNHLFTLDGSISVSCSGFSCNITVSSATKPTNYETNCLPDVDVNRAGIEELQKTFSVSIENIEKNLLTFLDIYPVGSIYISVNNVDPGTVFGGTWKQIKDSFLLAAGETHSSGETGGAESYEINESHKHIAPVGSNTSRLGLVSINGTVPGGNGKAFQTTPYDSSGTLNTNITLGYTSNATLNVNVPTMPPYLAVYMWERTA